MLMPNRHSSSTDYRFGFQNQETDPEIKGEGNSVNFKYRMYDPRIGRFFAVDPLADKYPYLTPYQFASNSTVYLIELEGLEGKIYLYKHWFDKNDKEHSEFIKVYDAPGLLQDVNKRAWKEYDNPDGKTIEYEYAVRMPDGTDGKSESMKKEAQPNSNQEVNKLLGLTAPVVEPKKEKTFAQKFNEIAPVWARDGYSEGNDSPSNLPNPNDLKYVAVVVVAVPLALFEFIFTPFFGPAGPGGLVNPDPHAPIQN